jgi:uncharacterized alpha-E superfamily protein
MLSRIADSMYWMSRYQERAGETARLMEINLLYLLEAEEDMTEEDKWLPILKISSSEGLFTSLYGKDVALTAQRMLQFISSERGNSNSIRSCVRLFRENARVARDRISKEMWEMVNELWMSINDRLKTPLTPEKARPFFVHLRNEISRFDGITANTMMRGESYSFYELGEFMERADMTARILDVKYHIILPDLALVGSALDYYQWAALLKSLSGFEAFKRKYHAGFRALDVVEFVIFERDFPRSIFFSVEMMGKALETIGLANKDRTAGAYAALRSLLTETTAELVFDSGLHEFIEELLARLGNLHAALAEEFFQ